MQLRNGMIPWYEGGHADPWNHVEAAMALDSAGLTGQAELAYGWLADSQGRDGSWCSYYLASGVEEPRRDTNFCAYVATGVWHHWLSTCDGGFLDSMWPTVEAAMDFVLSQEGRSPGSRPGELPWAVDPDGTGARRGLLAGSSSVQMSLGCALQVASQLGHERPEWVSALSRLRGRLQTRSGHLMDKGRWAMDWYYPALTGVLSGAGCSRRLLEGWAAFVVEEAGIRCVSDRPWVTAAETAECVMALESCGLSAEARLAFGWLESLRAPDGSYWTGHLLPERRTFPGGERSSYSAAAVVLASEVLSGGPARAIFGPNPRRPAVVVRSAEGLPAQEAERAAVADLVELSARESR